MVGRHLAQHLARTVRDRGDLEKVLGVHRGQRSGVKSPDEIFGEYTRWTTLAVEKVDSNV